MVWQASTDALGFDPFESDIVNMSNVWDNNMSRCGESHCRVVRSQGYLARPATERRGVARNIACYSTVQDPGIVKAGKPHDSVEHLANDSADRVSFPWRLWLRDKVLGQGDRRTGFDRVKTHAQARSGAIVAPSDVSPTFPMPHASYPTDTGPLGTGLQPTYTHPSVYGHRADSRDGKFHCRR